MVMEPASLDQDEIPLFFMHAIAFSSASDASS
jgi:hypothetical protein